MTAHATKNDRLLSFAYKKRAGRETCSSLAPFGAVGVWSAARERERKSE